MPSYNDNIAETRNRYGLNTFFDIKNIRARQVQGGIHVSFLIRGSHPGIDSGHYVSSFGNGVGAGNRGEFNTKPIIGILASVEPPHGGVSFVDISSKVQYKETAGGDPRAFIFEAGPQYMDGETDTFPRQIGLPLPQPVDTRWRNVEIVHRLNSAKIGQYYASASTSTIDAKLYENVKIKIRCFDFLKMPLISSYAVAFDDSMGESNTFKLDNRWNSKGLLPGYPEYKPSVDVPGNTGTGSETYFLDYRYEMEPYHCDITIKPEGTLYHMKNGTPNTTIEKDYRWYFHEKVQGEIQENSIPCADVPMKIANSPISECFFDWDTTDVYYGTGLVKYVRLRQSAFSHDKAGNPSPAEQQTLEEDGINFLIRHELNLKQDLGIT